MWDHATYPSTFLTYLYLFFSASERAASTLRGSVPHRRAIFRERHRPDLLRGRARHRGHDVPVDARHNWVRSKKTYATKRITYSYAGKDDG